MKTFFRTMTFLSVAVFGLAAKPAEAQVSVGVATPGFALGIGPGAGYVGVGGGYLPGYPVVAPPVFAPRPVFVPPPIYGRPYYGGGYVRGPVYGPRYAAPRYYRR